jgi:MFS family permease
MFATYRSVFRIPGTAAFCAASFVARMPLAMYALGIVLIISARDGKYGFAGVLSACYVFGNAIGQPLLSILVDRYGQRRLLLPAGAVHLVSGIGFALMLEGDAPDWSLVLPAVVFGFFYLPFGSLVRARWSNLLDGRPELSTALSLESVLDEVIFVFGPLIATVLATQADPVLVIYLGALLVTVGGVRLAALRATEPPVQPHGDERQGSALRAPGMVVVTLATIGMGAVFASAEVSMVAFCGQHGQRGLSGVALAAIAVGSGVSGLLYGAVEWRDTVLHRFRLQAGLFALLPFVLFASIDVPVLVVAAFVLGVGIAPALITTFSLIQQIVPTRQLTEGLSWVGTGLSVGYGAGAALVGGIADAHGARTAFFVVVGSSVLTGLLALGVRVRPGVDAAAPDGRTAVAP